MNGMLSPMEFKAIEYPNVGVVEPVRIYETMNYVEKENVENVEIHKSFRELMKFCFHNSEKISQTDFDEKMNAFVQTVFEKVNFEDEIAEDDIPPKQPETVEEPEQPKPMPPTEG